MSYDESSFLAGLAVGRMLWRPVQKSQNVEPYPDTGLGWTASPGFLVYDANTILATAEQSTRTPYTKNRDGYAICFVCENICDSQWSGDWVFLYLISTVQTNTDFSVPNVGGSRVEYDYLGMHWYIRGTGQSPSWGGASELITNYPVFHYNGENIGLINGNPLYEDEFQHLMQMAEVHLI